MTTIAEDTLCSVIVRRSLLLLAILAIAACAGTSLQGALGVLTGGAIAIGNFLWMGSTLRSTLVARPEKPFAHALLRFIGRMTVLGAILCLVLRSGWFSTVGLIVGLSVIVANIGVLSISSVHRSGG